MPEQDATLVVNRTGAEIRVSLVEGSRPIHVQIERERERSIVGNVYKGRVVRIVPGMQAAFVDIGHERAAFLYVGDVRVPSHNEDAETTDVTGPLQLDRTEDAEATQPGGDSPLADWAQEIQGQAPLDPMAVTTADERLVEYVDAAPPVRPRIEKLLSPGQEIIVQVSKAPLGTKGPRVTTQVSLPGRFLVYLAGATHVGVSRRIVLEHERERLRDVVARHRRPGEGFIVRTVCEGRAEDVLAQDIEFLRTRWQNIAQTILRSPAPTRVYEEPDVVLRAARDLLSPAITAMVVDDPDDFRRLSDFVARFLPTFRDRIQLHTDPTPIFEAFGVERALTRALHRTVRLPSGGYLVIEHTEALTAIDVNSGRFTGGANLAELTLKVNLEAAAAAAEQIRLRDIGGLIVIDFIDMESAVAREDVYEAILDYFASDPARASVLPISEFGLMEITRRRVKQNLARSLLEDCPTCDGRGQVKSADTVVYDVLREIQRQVALTEPGRSLRVRCSREIADRLKGSEIATLRALQDRLGGSVGVLAEAGWTRSRYEVGLAPRSNEG
jgi:ribonuclease G